MAIATGTAILAVGAIQAATSLAQIYTAERARGAAKKDLDELEQAFKAIIPPEYDVEITDPPELIANLPPVPDYEMGDINPEVLKRVGQYVPEVSEFVAMAAPELVEDTQTGLEARDAQMDVLRELSGILETGEDPAFDAKVQLAAQRGQEESQSRTQSILQDMARRGMLGSGLQASLQQQAASDTQANYADDMLLAAIASRDNEMQAMRDLADLGGNVRRDELALAEDRADAINRFNEQGTIDYRNYLQNRDSIRNKAQLYNLEEDQRIAEVNRADQYSADVANRDYRNRVKDRQYGQQVEQDEIKRRVQQQAFQNKRAVEDEVMRRQARSYDDQMRRVAGQQGIYRDAKDLYYGQGQDRIQAFQSAGDIASQVIGAYAKFGGQNYTKEQGPWSDVGRGELPSTRMNSVQPPGPYSGAPQTYEEPSIYDDDYAKKTFKGGIYG